MPTKNPMTIDNVFARMVVAVPKKPAAELVAIKARRRKVERLNPEKFFGFEDVDGFKEKALEKLDGQEAGIAIAAKGYPEIDYSFLAWRKKNTRLPAFIVLDLDSNKFSLSVDDDEDFSFEPDLPEAIANQFQKVIKYPSAGGRNWNRKPLQFPPTSRE
jgi:hypothetical protein